MNRTEHHMNRTSVILHTQIHLFSTKLHVIAPVRRFLDFQKVGCPAALCQPECLFSQNLKLIGLMIRRLWLLVYLLSLGPAYGQSILFQETVETTLPFPPGWQAARWTVTAQTPSSGSGGNSFTLVGQEGDLLCSPVLDARQATLTQLTYLARRTASYPTLHLVVRASIDGGQTFPYVIAPAGQALPQTDGSWVQLIFDLPSPLSGAQALQFCFDALGGQSSSARLQLDDIKLHGTGTLSRPPLAAFPPEVRAGFVALGDTLRFQLVLRNQTDSLCTVTPSPLPLPWWGQTGIRTLAPGQNDTLWLYVAPPTVSSWDTSWTLSAADFVLSLPFSVTSEEPTHYIGLLPLQTTALARDTLALALRLHLGNGALPLQGLLLSLELPPISWLSVAAHPGSSLPSPHLWTLQLTQQGRSATLLLLDPTGLGLQPGDYPELLRLQLVAADVNAQLSGKVILGAVQATAATPEALPITLDRYPRFQTLTVQPRQAYARLLADTVRLGPTTVGSSHSRPLRLANPNGLRSVRARIQPSSDPTLHVLPDSLEVAPGDTAAFTLTFRPTMRDFGWRMTTLRLQHNATIGDSLLVVEALGTGGLGDPTEDGRVDIADLQQGIRYVLGLAVADAQDRLTLDVAPFPHGDGQLRLTDLVVLVQAIARDAWPDDYPLPIPPPTLPAKSAKEDPPIVLYLLKEAPHQLRLQIEATSEFGAVQLMLPLPSAIRYDSTNSQTPTGAWLQVGQPRGRITFVLYRLDGQPFSPGTYTLGSLHGAGVDTLYPLRWLAVSTEGDYLPTHLRTILPPVPPAELPQQVLLMPPYPQPFFPRYQEAVIFSGILPTPSPLRVEVFDLLGRCLYTEQIAELPAGRFLYRWTGQDLQGRPVAAGLYLVRLQLATIIHTFPVIVEP